MKFMYKVPVTETYAIRSQVIMDGTVMKGNTPGSDYTAPGAGNDEHPEIPMD